MKIHRHNATAAVAAGLLLGVVASIGCTSSSYSVEVPAPAPSAGAGAAVGSAYAHDIPALTQGVNWDRVPVAAVMDGF